MHGFSDIMKLDFLGKGGTWLCSTDNWGIHTCSGSIAERKILQSLKQMCEQEGIRLAQVSAIGAVDHAVVGVYDLQEKRYHHR